MSSPSVTDTDPIMSMQLEATGTKISLQFMITGKLGYEEHNVKKDNDSAYRDEGAVRRSEWARERRHRSSPGSDSDSDSDTNSDEKLTLNEMMERAALSKASGRYSEKKLYVREVIS